MSRSIQTQVQYEAEKKRWDDYQEGKRSGIPSFQAAEPPSPKPADDYSDRFAKYIPAEVVTLYLALMAAAAQAPGNPTSVEWLVQHFGSNWQFWLNVVAFMAGLFATPADLYFRLKVRSRMHILICTGSFAVWALAIPDGLFKEWPPVIRGFLLPIYTFGVARYKPTPDSNDQT
jgi:hypothetical protein